MTYAYLSADIDLKVRLARREKEHLQNLTPNLYKPRICGPTQAWKVFYRQSDAFQFAKELDDVHVFAFESESFQQKSGQRSYLATSYEEFWHYYSQLSPKQRHHYEVIPEGAPCHLYFDLEFLRPNNAQLDGATLTQELIRYVCMMINKTWGIDCGPECVLQLEASTKHKFSRHLVFRLPKAVFKDNIQAGNFIKHIMNTLLYNVNSRVVKKTEQQSDTNTGNQSNEADDMLLSGDVLKTCELDLETLKKMLVKNKHDKDTLFCDLGVYTKNRNFRLYLSSKLRKNNPLIIAPENAFTVEHLKDSVTPSGRMKSPCDEEYIFLSSLVANVRLDEDTRILEFEDQKSNTSVGSTFPRSHSDTTGVTSNISGIEGSGNKSPFPEIDDFIWSLINKDGTQGKIRKWTLLTGGSLLLYDIADNRWCENIGRQHKSNNIMYMVDLKLGVYYQKCHDPDCKLLQYKSPDRPLPKEIIDLYLSQDSWSDEELQNPHTLEENRLHTNLERSGDDDSEELSDSELMQYMELQEQNESDLSLSFDRLHNSCDLSHSEAHVSDSQLNEDSINQSHDRSPDELRCQSLGQLLDKSEDVSDADLLGLVNSLEGAEGIG